jgi:formamidopyrimidine-DNA glycosylase
MPELAEVEAYRKKWNEGIGQPITRVHLHAEKRIFRGTDTAAIEKQLPRKKMAGSESRGKQMLFQFSGNIWIGIHLGMTGKLSIAAPDYTPEKHDHFVLFQKKRALVFNDMRQFGRVLFHHGKEAPEWWDSIAPGVTSPEFTLEYMSTFLDRHGRLPIKASLLLQKGFPGVGNWMADEILWRAGIAPSRKSSALKPPERKKLWTQARFVCHEALEKIGGGDAEPPAGWLFHQRWSVKGICPKHKSALRRDTVGGRTTAWCPRCQK